MSDRFNFSIELGKGTKSSLGMDTPKAPLNIIVFGDFSGRCLRPELLNPSTNGYPIREIDIDRLDQVIERLKPAVPLSVAETCDEILFTFQCLEDFHPDHLYQQPAFRQLAESVMQSEGRKSENLSKEQTISESSPLPEGDAETVKRLLGRSPLAAIEGREDGTQQIGEASVRERVQHLAQQIMKSQLEASTSAEDDERNGLNNASSPMRLLLHSAGFQALEAAWRSLDWLLRSIETGSDTKVYLIDICKEELAPNPGESRSNAYDDLLRDLQQITAKTTLNDSVSILIGNYTFGPGGEDFRSLDAIGGMASSLRSPFIATAAPALVGCTSFYDTPRLEQWTQPIAASSQAWNSFLQSANADWIGLALPRVLLRLPYGTASDPIDCFAFEELSDPNAHECYLWGNPAFACAILIATGWSGDAAKSGSILEIHDMPAYTYRDGGDIFFKPCAETVLGERESDALLTQGMIPVICHRESNRIRIPCLRALGGGLSDIAH